jgi:hypothetical protein
MQDFQAVFAIKKGPPEEYNDLGSDPAVLSFVLYHNQPRKPIALTSFYCTVVLNSLLHVVD